MKRVRGQLRLYLGSSELVDLRRRSDVGVTSGFVVGLGAKWVLLACVSDGGYFDGHRAFLVRDLRRVRASSHFQARFARTQPEWPPALPERATAIDQDSTRGVLRTLVRAGELVGIESNHKYSALWIGVPDEIVGAVFYLWEIDTHASWHDQPRGYRIRRVVEIRVGGLYLRALAATAEQPAPKDPDAPVWPEKRTKIRD